MADLIKCPNCHNEVPQSNFCNICGFKFNNQIIEKPPTIQKNETKITVKNGSSCLSGITQGVGCVIGAILTVIVILLFLAKTCSH
ncbi:MAG: hypothetical protein ABR980_14120 [Ignavibacteriaceae bacterium]|jgi:hypothetical protein